MPPAARVTDTHVCPKVEPGPVPHVGGPILPAGEPTVIIGFMAAAREGDMATCVGPPDKISKGEASVLIGNKPAARLGDPMEHGGHHARVSDGDDWIVSAGGDARCSHRAVL